MKKAKPRKADELRPEYKRSDFPGKLVRGKYHARSKESSNVVVLRPEVAEVFPNEESVNDALLSLIRIARKTSSGKKKRNGLQRTKHNPHGV